MASPHARLCGDPRRSHSQAQLSHENPFSLVAAFTGGLAALVAPAVSQVEAPPSYTTPYGVDNGWVEIAGGSSAHLELVDTFQVVQAGSDGLRASGCRSSMHPTLCPPHSPRPSP